MTQLAQAIDTIEEPRLEPIENPGHPMVRLAYWLTKRRFGKAITPLKVVYARYPRSLGLARKLVDVDESLSLDEDLKHLLKMYIASLNGCGFCTDMTKALAQSGEVESGKFDALLAYEESDLFTSREKAALSYVEAITRSVHVSDEVFDRLSVHFDEEEIVQLTLLTAIENFYNRVAAPLNIGSDELCKLQGNS